MNHSARIRLALVACKDDNITPWAFCTGEEVGVDVCSIGDDEVVTLLVEDKSGNRMSYGLRAGYFAIPELSACKKYRLIKSNSVGNYPTFVEIKLRG